MTSHNYDEIFQHATGFLSPHTKRSREHLRDEWITYAMNVWGITKGEATDIAIAAMKSLDDAPTQSTTKRRTKNKWAQPVMLGFE
jgi:hypothetical protein